MQWWHSRRVRRLFAQTALAAGLLLLIWILWRTIHGNLAAQNIRSGFGFLTDRTGFNIGEHLIAYSSNDSYARAFFVGLLNTLRVAVFGIVTASLIGLAIGLASLSKNRLVALLATAYVEILRNIPLLIQLLAIYLALTELLPDVTEPLALPGSVLLSKSGLQFPFFSELNGVWGWHAPALDGLMVVGGASLTPEFLALWLGLSLFTGAYIAEIVRGGMLSVDRGQWEAAQALGLPRRLTIRRVVLPQALRVIVPPLTSQYLNLTKNSSLAVAIGYPDIVSVSNTTINLNGQALECIAIIMAVYLSLNLITALLMNRYNRHVTLH